MHVYNASSEWSHCSAYNRIDIDYEELVVILREISLEICKNETLQKQNDHLCNILFESNSRLIHNCSFIVHIVAWCETSQDCASKTKTKIKCN